MSTYIFTLDLPDGYKIVIEFAWSLGLATQEVLDREGCKEYNIMSVLIKAQ